MQFFFKKFYQSALPWPILPWSFLTLSYNGYFSTPHVFGCRISYLRWVWHRELTHTFVQLVEGWGNVNKNMSLLLSLLIRNWILLDQFNIFETEFGIKFQKQKTPISAFLLWGWVYGLILPAHKSGGHGQRYHIQRAHLQSPTLTPSNCIIKQGA
jgi:hypothetical protein